MVHDRHFDWESARARVQGREVLTRAGAHSLHE